MTNARIQRWIVLSSLIFWWCIAAWLWPEHRALAVICVFVPLIITPALLALQCALAAKANQHDRVPPASLADWLMVWMAEWRIATLVFSFWQPFRHHAWPDRTQPATGQRGIVLVHGFFCNRALWTPWMKRLHANQRAFIAVDLEPAFSSISRYADVIERAITQLERTTGMPPVLVGHSMGGLAIRAWAAQYGSVGSGMARIHHIFTLGTPHHGTALAKMSHTRNGHQMQQGSDWLIQNLAALPDDFPKKLTCFYSNCDNIVFPASTATINGADNRLVLARGHVELAFVADIEQICVT